MDKIECFAKRVREKMGAAVPSDVPRGTWKNKRSGNEYNHIYQEIRENFIDGIQLTRCDMKGDLSGKDINYHVDATHMNSSQVMCINYFYKFFEHPDFEAYLLTILMSFGIEIDIKDNIRSASFEYVPNATERTSLDFYMVLESWMAISFEIKYTEHRFGLPKKDPNDPDKYKRRWNNIYKDMVKQSSHLNLGKRAFYNNYQINRNILYANSCDYVLFITPRANDSMGICRGRSYIDSLENDHIRNIYWEDLIQKTLEVVDKCDELKEYYQKFYDKYIGVL
ncbi:MAG: hypothetical protein Q4E51_06580 [Lachnospiraceae bacterium]|nr:hypothetical protein [Lachnospiraceae bacterium]